MREGTFIFSVLILWGGRPQLCKKTQNLLKHDSDSLMQVQYKVVNNKHDCRGSVRFENGSGRQVVPEIRFGLVRPLVSVRFGCVSVGVVGLSGLLCLYLVCVACVRVFRLLVCSFVCVFFVFVVVCVWCVGCLCVCGVCCLGACFVWLCLFCVWVYPPPPRSPLPPLPPQGVSSTVLRRASIVTCRVVAQSTPV